ncbi:hypothetical protein JCM1840_001061 [Sporobolomyces johnsonii]
MAGGGAAATGVRAVGNITKRQQWFAFGLVTSLFFLWGFSYGLVDVLNKKTQTFFGITKLQSTMVQVAYFGAYIVFSPVAAQFASRFGYKRGIYLGLALYSIGALCFWPASHYEKYPAFPASAFVIACGLATLETMANSYITVLGDPEHAAFRLNAAQSTNGLAAFIGPLIASETFFKDENATSLGSVQYVYLGVACLGAAVMVLYFFATLPEISEDAMAEQQESTGIVDERPLWKRKHTVFGFIAQFCYVGAQVTVASFVLNFLTDDHAYTSSEASRMLSYLQICFMVARFVSTPLLRIFPPAAVLAGYSMICTVFSLVAALTNGGKAGLASLFVIFFAESVIYPTIFSIATSNLGHLTKRGAGLLCMGVGGGAAFPPAQGALADSIGSIKSYVIPCVGFFVPMVYGGCMVIYERRMAAIVQANAITPPPIARADSSEKVDSDKTETEFIA